LNEPALIKQLQQKQEPAFRQLVETYQDKVYATVFNMLMDVHEAEDTAQEVFIRVYESIGNFRQESSLSTWIYRIAVRKAIDKLRKRKYRQKLDQWFRPDNPSGKNPEEACLEHPGVLSEQKEKAVALFRAVSQLPLNQQTAFTLVKIQGMRYDDAAAAMDMNIKAVESLISRAKIKLQKMLEKHHRP
jgi:RNA polymerase sigma-70 factor (ECF subfamily)